WTLEHVAAYVAGGLPPDEVERLEAHTRDCPPCASALAEARAFDRTLGSLFAGVRPGPDLEDRAVRKFRDGPARKPGVVGGYRGAMAAVAALLILGTFGATVGSIANGGRLPMPGDSYSGYFGGLPRSANSVHQLALGIHEMNAGGVPEK